MMHAKDQAEFFLVRHIIKAKRYCQVSLVVNMTCITPF
jgi:hypothetical protein